MTDDGPENLLDHYHSWMAETWSGDEESIPMGMLRKEDGSLTMVALALEPDQAYQVMLQMVITEEATECVFALDRFTKEGQGTKYADVLAGHYFDRSLGRKPWKPFIIEYQREPRLFEPVNFDNEFWNASLTMEMNVSMRRLLGRVVESALS
jgi:hypothetical protein